ncbi:MAG: histidine kinase [Mycobacterium sp.]|uniref:PAS domain-containing protein n=1 Tax=Mycobacterium sp. TaxID=1785 RepID=UPI000CC5344B|nr:PAS domain-containing protein [Mycobacterium sp.]PJE02190.1 MAG: histidine kinase [Mycobacterium sp.]PJE05684.1 MAG: histidine kinase [Mycobacterium sp.]PJE24351.1 MAG: histidine kinase [Mycobacterium sp.]
MHAQQADEADHYAGVERRRSTRAGQSPGEVLRQLPATVVLDRLPIPVLGVGCDGSITFANAALCAMLGYCHDDVRILRCNQIFRSCSANEPALDFIRAHGNELVTLTHSQRFSVRAWMSKSALLRHHDPMVLVTFREFTEQLWLHDPH